MEIKNTLKAGFYSLNGERVPYYSSNGSVPSSVENTFGIVHMNPNKQKQILVCKDVSEPTYIRLINSKDNSNGYMGVCQWENGKELSVYNPYALCIEKKENILNLI